MPRASRERRRPSRRSVSYLIAVGAVGTVGTMPLLSAAPALADPAISVNVTVQVGEAAHITLPGSGSYAVYSWPTCGKAYWSGTAYTFDTADTSGGRPACTPGATVNALEDTGSGDRINVNITVTPAPLALPSAPAAPSVTPGIGQLTINWLPASADEQVDGYEYTVDGGLTWMSGTAPTTVTGLVFGVAYQVGVRSHNATGYGPPSPYTPMMTLPFIPPPIDPTPPTPPVDPTPPTPPVDPTPPTTPTVTPPAAPSRPVVTVGNRSISISWSAVTGATGYEYSLDGGHSWSKPTTHRSVTVAGLQNGHAYSVRVRALTGTVAGAASVAVSGTPQQPVAAAPALPPLQQQGSRGSDVARIQRLLGIPADGIFGPQTAGAVRAFQLAHHLQVDGIVGRQTWTALLSGTSTAPASRPWLRFGSTGSYVRELQQRLGGLAVDGIFGPKTRAGVFAFQSSHHLMVDGIVGTQTWAALPAR